MAKRTKQSDFGNFRPGRHSGHLFDAMVSPLGEDCVENNGYSPDHEVTGAASQAKPQSRASRSESAKDQRRGG